jgi:hypothetical protein
MLENKKAATERGIDDLSIEDRHRSRDSGRPPIRRLLAIG